LAEPQYLVPAGPKFQGRLAESQRLVQFSHLFGRPPSLRSN